MMSISPLNVITVHSIDSVMSHNGQVGASIGELAVAGSQRGHLHTFSPPAVVSAHRAAAEVSDGFHVGQSDVLNSAGVCETRRNRKTSKRKRRLIMIC